MKLDRTELIRLLKPALEARLGRKIDTLDLEGVEVDEDGYLEAITVDITFSSHTQGTPHDSTS